MMKTAIALGVLVALAGCSKPEKPVGYSLNGVSIYHADLDGNLADWIPGADPIRSVVYYTTGPNTADKAMRVKRNICFIDAKVACSVKPTERTVK